MTQLAVALAPTLPPPKKLIVEGGSGAAVAYACPTCGLLFILGKDEAPERRAEKMQEAAAHCVKNCACGVPVESHYHLRCATCSAALEATRERQRFDAAKKLTIEEYPDHPVFWPGKSGDMDGEGYFSSVDMLLDYCEDQAVDVPEYVYACTRQNLQLDALAILENALEQVDMEPETAAIPTEKGKQLQAFLDAWLKEVDVHSWFEDKSRVIVLRKDFPSTPPTAA